MHIEENLNKGLERKYTVTIEQKALEEFVTEQASKLAHTSKTPGFRPGKTPLSLIKSTHKFEIQSKAAEHFVQEAIRKIIEDKKINLASRPVLNDINQDDNQMKFTLEMELLPEIPSLKLEDITLDKYNAPVGEKEIKETENEFLKHHKSFEPSKTAAKLGDITVIDAVGYMNGKEFEGGKVIDHRLELGSKAFIDGFEDGLVGVKTGDTKRLKLKFPEKYHMKDYSNKPVEFEVTVKDVLKAIPAKIDEDLAKKLQAKNTKEIHEKIKDSAQHYYDNLANLILRKEMLDYMDQHIKIDLPPKLLAQETETIKKSEEGKDHTEKELKKIAERRTKLGLIMAKISQEQKINISEDDIKAEVTKQIQQMPQQAQAIIEYYQKNPAATESLRGQILENKTMTFILEKIKTNQKKVTPEKISKIYSEIIKRPIE